MSHRRRSKFQCSKLFVQLKAMFIVYGCFLDLDPFIFLLYYPVEIAEELRASVHEGTGLTCSAGVAPNRMLAKVSLGRIQLVWLYHFCLEINFVLSSMGWIFQTILML